MNMFDRKSHITHMFNSDELNQFFTDDMPELKKQLIISYILAKQEAKSVTVSLLIDNKEFVLTDEL